MRLYGTLEVEKILLSKAEKVMDARVTNVISIPPGASRKITRNSAFFGAPWFDTRASRLLDHTPESMRPTKASNTAL